MAASWTILSITFSTILPWPNATRLRRWPPSTAFRKEIYRKLSPPATPIRLRKVSSGRRDDSYLSPLGGAIPSDLVDHAHSSGMPKRILILTQIFFGQRINMRVSTLLGDVHHLTLHGQMAIGIIGIDDGEGHFLVAPHVFVFHSPLGCVDSDVGSVVIQLDRW